jgi:nitrous oxidase accessory protein NosD
VSHPLAARGNDWRDNYWDEYAGFDRNGDGVGDLPYEVYAYADHSGWTGRSRASFAARSRSR